jgi:hypothetical protein
MMDAGLMQVGLDQHKGGAKYQKCSKRPLELPSGEGVGKIRSGSGSYNRRDGKRPGRQKINIALQAIDQCPGDSGEDQGDQTGSVRLMLTEFQDADHQGNHNQAAAQTNQASEQSGGKSDGQAD